MNNLPSEDEINNWYKLLYKYVESVRDTPVSDTGNYYTLKDYTFADSEIYYDEVLGAFMLELKFELWRNYELCGTFKLTPYVKDVIEFGMTIDLDA